LESLQDKRRRESRRQICQILRNASISQNH
jgi:hypothetical protein